MLPLIPKITIVHNRSLKEDDDDNNEMPEKYDKSEMIGLKLAAKDLLEAIKKDDPDQVAEALQSAFFICDSIPHEEGPHFE